MSQTTTAARVPSPAQAACGLDIVHGLDGWLFQREAVELLSGQRGTGLTEEPALQAAAAGEVANAWRQRLSNDAGALAAAGIRYLHVCVPDKLSLFSECLGAVAMDSLQGQSVTSWPGAAVVADLSPMRLLNSRYKAQLPCLLDPSAYLSRQKENYPLYWKADARWTPWACYMTYQLLCGLLGAKVNNQLLGYPYHEAPRELNLDRDGLRGYSRASQEQLIRTYRFQMRSRRRFANPLAQHREAVFESADPASTLDAHALGSQVVFENRHNDAVDQTIVVFGDANAGDGRTLFTGMLAETFVEVHFIWGPAVDWNYVDRVRPDVVVTMASELTISRAPVADFSIRDMADSTLQALRQAMACVDAGTPMPGTDRRSMLAAGSVASAGCRLLLGREEYELPPPGVLQAHGPVEQADAGMQSNEIRLTDVQQASVYFTGGSWLVHDGAGREVLRHEVPANQKPAGRWTRRTQLSGKVLMLGSSSGAHCYYHWMLEILPKLGLLQRDGTSPDDIDYFLVRKITGDWQLETLMRVGIDRSRIIETEQQPHLSCDRLLHVDLNCGINLKMHRFIPLWMKHLFPVDTQLEDRLKLYITRPPGVRRGISNEDEFLPLLRQAGFTIMAMEGLSVAAQAALLARTDVLMSPHGGALTNMVFCRPGITVIELFSRHVFPYYYGLAANCGHHYHAIFENPAEDFPRLVSSRVAQSHAAGQHETAGLNFAVPVEAIQRLLESLSL